nr:hypothetical protein PHYPA_017123 [Physcomitrium patens]
MQPLPLGQAALFKLPLPGHDDDEDRNECMSLREWQPEEPTCHTVVSNGTSYRAWEPVKEKDSTASNGIPTMKGSVRTRPLGYVPLVEANRDVTLPSSIVGVTRTKQLPLAQPELTQEEDQHENGHESGTSNEDPEDELEDEVTDDITEPEVKERKVSSHHRHNISLVNGIAPPPTQLAQKGGIAFDISHHQESVSVSPRLPHVPKGGIAFDITLDDHDVGSLPRRSTGSSRDSSRRVSFVTGQEVELDSPNSSRSKSKSPYRSQQNNSRNLAKNKPGWDSSAKVGNPPPPMPKKFVRPTLHGIKVKKGQGGVAKTAMRASMTSAEVQNGTAGVSRPRDLRVARSWDPQYCGGGEYDTVSQLISKSFMASNEDTKEDSRGFSIPFLPRSNDGRKQDDHGEALKQSGSETNKLTGLFSKLRRASAPLSKAPSKVDSKAVSPRLSSVPVISKLSRENSAPVDHSKTSAKRNLAPLHSLDSSGANQKYSIGSYASLKLLQECAKTEQIPAMPAYNTHKPRKIRDHEPHRHYYKTISKTLDSKLKS